jgi:hypothetical protein
MMDSMTIISRNRDQIQNNSNNRSNSQSLKTTPAQLHPNITIRDKPRASHNPSENCSLIDEHEDMHIPHMKNGGDESNLSSGSKNSDKENSNIRNN